MKKMNLTSESHVAHVNSIWSLVDKLREVRPHDAERLRLDSVGELFSATRIVVSGLSLTANVSRLILATFDDVVSLCDAYPNDARLGIVIEVRFTEQLYPVYVEGPRIENKRTVLKYASATYRRKLIDQDVVEVRPMLEEVSCSLWESTDVLTVVEDDPFVYPIYARYLEPGGGDCAMLVAFHSLTEYTILEHDLNVGIGTEDETPNTNGHMHPCWNYVDDYEHAIAFPVDMINRAEDVVVRFDDISSGVVLVGRPDGFIKSGDYSRDWLPCTGPEWKLYEPPLNEEDFQIGWYWINSDYNKIESSAHLVVGKTGEGKYVVVESGTKCVEVDEIGDALEEDDIPEWWKNVQDYKKC